MAIIPESQYPGKIAPSSAAYPYGQARNITTPGDGTGTPWEAAIVNDFLGFLQSILSEAGVVPSGTPDSVTAPQYLPGVKRAVRNDLATASYATMIARHATQSYADGDVVTLTDAGISGPGAVVYSVGHGITSTAGVDVRLDDDHYWHRSYSGQPTPEWWVMTEGSGSGFDNSTAFQAFVNFFGYLYVPIGIWDIENPITIPSGTSGIGYQWLGEGMERSVINCVNMAGMVAIQPATTTQFIRLTMRDFAVFGDADSCIDLTVDTAYQVYQSAFQNLNLRCNAGDCFVANEHFSCSWINVHVDSQLGHGFNLEGGNSTVLINCYAHYIGPNKAGYRIMGNALMLACNGIDNLTDPDVYWGWFGSSAENIGYKVRLVQCNMEDWGNYAIRCENFGNLTGEGTAIVARSSGTYSHAIDAYQGSNHQFKFDRGTGVITKGATRTSSAELVAAGSCFLSSEAAGGTGVNTWANFYRSDQALLYTAPVSYVNAVEFGKHGMVTTDAKAGRERGYIAPDVSTWTANTGAFDVTGLNAVQTANTVATNMTNASGTLKDGSELRILVKDANSTIKHMSGGTGQFRNSSGADIVATSGYVYTFIANSNIWHQV